MEAQKMRIGFIGLGRMGSGMATNLARAGLDLTVYDLSPDATAALSQAGAKIAASLPELVQSSDVIFTSLPGPLQVEAVVFGAEGILTNCHAGQILFDLTSSSREMTLRVHKALADKGCAMFDAPVSGGPAGAKSGDLVLWIGGERRIYDHHLALLQVFSKPHYVGEVGAGTVTKLAHNLLGYTIMQAQAEAFTLAVKAGLDPMDFWEALRLGMVGKQPPLFMLTQQFLPYEFGTPAFAQYLGLKDVRLALAMAEELRVPMRLSQAMREDMEAVVARGEGEGDSRSFLQLQVERAGVAIKVPRARIKEAITRNPR